MRGRSYMNTYQGRVSLSEESFQSNISALVLFLELFSNYNGLKCFSKPFKFSGKNYKKVLISKNYKSFTKTSLQ